MYLVQWRSLQSSFTCFANIVGCGKDKIIAKYSLLSKRLFSFFLYVAVVIVNVDCCCHGNSLPRALAFFLTWLEWKSSFYLNQWLIRSTDNTQEAAFTTALLSAALAYNVALACTEKDVTECSCEEVKRRPFREQSTWKWKGCSVNVGFGSSIAGRFMLSYRSNNTQSSIIDKHNVRVGLEVNK